MEERKPETGRLVVAYDGFFICLGTLQEDESWSSGYTWLCGEVTHWLPIPELPPVSDLTLYDLS